MGQRKDKWYWVIFLIVVFTLVGALMFTVHKFTNSTQQRLPLHIDMNYPELGADTASLNGGSSASLKLPVDERHDWEVYTNEQYGFEFMVPKEINVNVHVVDGLPEIYTFDSWAQRLDGVFDEECSSLDGRTEVTVVGKRFLVRTIEAWGEGLPCGSNVVNGGASIFALHRNENYAVIIEYADEYSKIKGVAPNILKSLGEVDD